MSENKSQHGALMSLAVVFFFWGFVAASNGIFIPFCKAHFKLTQYASQLIDASFYAAYFFGSFILYLLSQYNRHDVLNRIGYKSGIIYGLLGSVAGAALLAFFSGTGNATFGMILGAFFLIALGFSLQQTAANPFVVALGPVETGSHRLNFTGGVNSFGTLLGPIVVSLVLFGAGAEHHADLANIETLYIILAVLFVLVALFLFMSKGLPAITNDDTIENSSKATLTLTAIAVPTAILLFFSDFLPEWLHNNFIFITLLAVVGALLFALSGSGSNSKGWGAMHYPQLVLGMLAIFTYVGVEVTIQSNLGALLKTEAFGGYEESRIASFISLYWGSLMIGRWTGAISSFGLKAKVRSVLTLILPFIAFALIIAANAANIGLEPEHPELGSKYDQFLTYLWQVLPYAGCIAVAVAAFLIGNERPARTLLLFSIIGIAGMTIGLLTTGKVALYAFISGGLACSILWPGIFALSVAGLGKYTSQGAAFLIMMILGGAIIPPIQGKIADAWGIHESYFIPVLCFVYLAFFAVRVRALLQRQGINVDALGAEAH